MSGYGHEMIDFLSWLAIVALLAVYMSWKEDQ